MGEDFDDEKDPIRVGWLGWVGGFFGLLEKVHPGIDSQGLVGGRGFRWGTGWGQVTGGGEGGQVEEDRSHVGTLLNSRLIILGAAIADAGAIVPVTILLFDIQINLEIAPFGVLHGGEDFLTIRIPHIQRHLALGDELAAFLQGFGGEMGQPGFRNDPGQVGGERRTPGAGHRRGMKSEAKLRVEDR